MILKLLFVLGAYVLVGRHIRPGVSAAEWGARIALRRTRVLPIRAVRDGQVARINGRVRCLGVPLVAPLSGRPCVAYRVRVLRGTWFRVVDAAAATEFLVDDGTGRARVGAGQELVIYSRRRHTLSPQDAPGTAIRQLLDEHGVDYEGVFAGRDMTCEEVAVAPDAMVTVRALARWEPDPEPGGVAASYREAPRRLVLLPTDDDKVLVSDDPETVAAQGRLSGDGEPV